MKFEDYYVYIASPFFNSKEIELIEDIEFCLQSNGFKFYSPRSEGIIKHLPIEEKEKLAHDIYMKNLQYMNNTNFMISVIDGFDPGTVFEVGYFTALKKPIITLTSQKKLLNIMLRESVVGHLYGIAELSHLLNLIKNNDPNPFKEFNCKARDIE